MQADTGNYADIYATLTDIFQEKLPFNRVLDIKVQSLDMETAMVKFAMRPELIGNFVLQTLHGGVISAVLDATGGILALAGVVKKLAGQSREAVMQKVATVGTIDLRIDYLRPGRGDWFAASATVMRAGRKVAVTRMELLNDQDVLVAVGTGTYLVG